MVARRIVILSFFMIISTLFPFEGVFLGGEDIPLYNQLFSSSAPTARNFFGGMARGMIEKWGVGWRFVWVDERKCRGDDAFCMGCFQGVLKKGGLKGGKWGNGKRWKGSSSVQKCEKKGLSGSAWAVFLSPHWGPKVPQKVLWRGWVEKMWNWHFARFRLEWSSKWLITNELRGKCEFVKCEFFHKYTPLKAGEREEISFLIYYLYYYKLT